MRYEVSLVKRLKKWKGKWGWIYTVILEEEILSTSSLLYRDAGIDEYITYFIGEGWRK